LGKTKSKRQNGSNDQSQKKRRDYRCRTQEAFSIDESSMGGKTESRSQDEINLPGASLGWHLLALAKRVIVVALFVRICAASF